VNSPTFTAKLVIYEALLEDMLVSLVLVFGEP
jgi:hypothetical protein